MAARAVVTEQLPDPEEEAALARATRTAIRLAGDLARRTEERDSWRGLALRLGDLLADEQHTQHTLATEAQYWYERCDILQGLLDEAIHRFDTGLT